MTTLVLQAHPLKDSYNAALLDAIVARLDLGRRDSPTVIRLGQGDTLTAASFHQSTEFVVVYPTWWGSPPAMLMASLVPVIGPWVDGDEPRSTSPLRSIQSLTVVTSHGSSKLVNRLQGEPGRQLWKRTVLPLCAAKATLAWKSLYKLDRASAGDRTDFLRSVEASVART